MKTNMVKAALFTPMGRGRWGLPIILWGEPGIAKSDIVERIAADYGFPCEVLSPGERGEGAFGVVPVPDGKGAKMVLRNPRPDWAEKFDESSSGVLFVDEVTTCFVAGTLVTSIRDGVIVDVPIETLEIGDQVTGLDLNRRACRSNLVYAKKRTKNRPTIDVRLEDGRCLRCTADHPFFVGDRWKRAGELSIGDEVTSLRDLRGGAQAHHEHTFANALNDIRRLSSSVSWSTSCQSGGRCAAFDAFSSDTTCTYERPRLCREEATRGAGTCSVPRESLNRRECGHSEEIHINLLGSSHSRGAQTELGERTSTGSRPLSRPCITRWQERRCSHARTDTTSGSERTIQEELVQWRHGFDAGKESSSCDCWANPLCLSDGSTFTSRAANDRVARGAGDSVGVHRRWSITSNDPQRASILAQPRLFDRGTSLRSSARPLDAERAGNGSRGLPSSRMARPPCTRAAAEQSDHLALDDLGISVGVRVVSVTPGPDAEVFDISVTRDANFFANGVLVHNCPPAVQPPLLGLFLRGVIGATQLPPGVRRIGAANPPDLAASGYDLPTAVANRVVHIDWEAPSVEDRAAYRLRGDDDFSDDLTTVGGAQVEEERVKKAWPEAHARAVGLELAFLRAFPQHKNQCPKAGDPKGSRAWPSDRSWTLATRAYAASYVHGLSASEREEFVAGAIGAGVASEFFGFCEAQDMPNAADVLDGKVTFAHSSARIDRTAALLGACAALVVPTQAAKRNDRVAKLWEILSALAKSKADLDVLVPVAQAMVAAKLNLGSWLEPASHALAPLHGILIATRTP